MNTTTLTFTERPITGFVYLQFLDLMTTVAFLVSGAMVEGNPFVRFLMASTSHPFAGLLLAKCLAIVFGTYAWRTGRHAVLRKANVFFALIVAWNIFGTILGSVN